MKKLMGILTLVTGLSLCAPATEMYANTKDRLLTAGIMVFGGLTAGAFLWKEVLKSKQQNDYWYAMAPTQQCEQMKQRIKTMNKIACIGAITTAILSAVKFGPQVTSLFTSNNSLKVPKLFGF